MGFLRGDAGFLGSTRPGFPRIVEGIARSGDNLGDLLFGPIVWDGLDDQRLLVSSGVYFYRLETSGSNLTKKLVVMK